MAQYAYRAVSGGGSLKEGNIDANTQNQAVMRLRNVGLRVVTIKETARIETAQTQKRVGKKPSAGETGSVVRQMAILLKAGIPLVEGLSGLAEQTKSASLKSAVLDIAECVKQGMTLSDALSRHPNVFPSIAADMVRVAETGGNLHQSMSELADHLETADDIRRKIVSAMAYPIVVLSVSVITVIGMILFIVPRFAAMFKKMGTELPLTTKMLLGLSQNMTTYWIVYVVVIVGGFLWLRRYLNQPSGKYLFDKMLLKFPLIGEITMKIVLARAMAAMSSLLSSGVSMVKALETSASAANNEIVKEALLKARRDVAEGSATSEALRATRMFPPLVLQLVASGERTGELPGMLEYVCRLYDREVESKVKSLTSVIEPVMILILGVVVGFIALSIIVPIYSVVGSGK